MNTDLLLARRKKEAENSAPMSLVMVDGDEVSNILTTLLTKSSDKAVPKTSKPKIINRITDQITHALIDGSFKSQFPKKNLPCKFRQSDTLEFSTVYEAFGYF